MRGLQELPMLKMCAQLLLVTTPAQDSVEGTMTPYSRDAEGAWHQAMPSFPVVVGRKGMAWDEETLQNLGRAGSSRIKREGDGCSPIGCFPLIAAFGIAQAADILMPYHPIQGLEGVDDPASRHYNRLVRRHEINEVDWKSAEKMEDYELEYAWGAVVGYNWHTPKPHAGSCIFLHVWLSPQKGTSGCTAMEGDTMLRILKWLDSTCYPYLVQCPASVYEDLREVEQLPVLRTP